MMPLPATGGAAAPRGSVRSLLFTMSATCSHAASNLVLFSSASDRHLNGGAGRDRTDDLKLAKLPLSQLSYGPEGVAPADLVGLGRFELPTSPLSGVRSNQLSYRPEPMDALSVAAGSAGRLVSLAKKEKRGRQHPAENGRLLDRMAESHSLF